jgi:predicted RNase H-like HicB family nuclease
MTGPDDAAGGPTADRVPESAPDPEDVIVLTTRADGTVAAKDRFTGLVRGGDTRAEALARLAEALANDEDHEDELADPDALRADDVEGELTAEEVRDDREFPDFLE